MLFIDSVLADSLSTGLILSSSSGQIQGVNRAARILLNERREVPLDTHGDLRSLISMLAEQAVTVQPSIDSWLKEIEEGKSPQDLVFWFEGEVARSVRTSRSATEILLQIEDCTEQFRTHRLLGELERAVNGGVVEFSLLTNEILFSDGIWEIFGEGGREKLSHIDDWITFIDPAHRERVAALVQNSIASGEPFAAEYPMNLPDGRQIWIKAAARFVEDRSGNSNHAIGVFQDTTVLRQQETRIRERETLTQAIFDASADIISLIETGQIKYVSRAVERVLGYDPVEILDRTVESFLHEDDRTALGTMQVGEEPGSVYHVEARVRDSEGQWRHMEIRAKAATASSDGAFRYVVVARDVTQQRADERRIRQSEKLDSLGQLAGGVAHDFNNLLTTILGNSDLIVEDDTLPAPGRARAEQIRQAAERAAGLTRQLLAFTHHTDMSREAVDVHELIREAAIMLERTIDKRFVIDLQLQAERPVLIADADSVHTAILNLGLNARDAMADGGKITFRTENLVDVTPNSKSVGELARGNYLQLDVIDEGHGIAEDDLLRIFEPFFTNKPLGQGTGLGLASVHGCAISHEGLVEVTSSTAQGTVFRLLLPISEMPLEAPLRMQAGSTITGRAHVMVVDDEEGIREMVSEALPLAGFTVTAWSSGAEASAWFSTHHAEVDLVLLDMSMPGMSGSQTLTALQQIDPQVRVVVASGYSLADAPEDMLKRGAIDYVLKPFRLEQLYQTLSDAIVRQR